MYLQKMFSCSQLLARPNALQTFRRAASQGKSKYLWISVPSWKKETYVGFYKEKFGLWNWCIPEWILFSVSLFLFIKISQRQSFKYGYIISCFHSWPLLLIYNNLCLSFTEFCSVSVWVCCLALLMWHRLLPCYFLS